MFVTENALTTNEIQTLFLFILCENRAEEQVPSYPVAISPEMVSKLEDCLHQLDVAPINLNTAPMSDNKEISLLVKSLNKFDFLFINQKMKKKN